MAEKLLRLTNMNDVNEKLRTVLGRGYDMTNRYAWSQDCKESVIDLKKVLADTNTSNVYIARDANIGSGSSTIIIGETMTKYRKNYSMSIVKGASVSGGLDAIGKLSFSAETGHSFNKEISETNNRLFSTKMFYVAKDANFFNTNTVDMLREFLSDRFKGDLNVMRPKDIIRKYGTHVLLGGILGGRLDYHLSTVSTEKNAKQGMASYIEAKVGAAIDGIEVNNKDSMKMAAEIEKTYKYTLTDTKTEVYGGQQHLALSEKANYDKWLESIDDKNMVWMDFYSNSLVMLSEFVVGGDKREELRVEIFKHIKPAINIPQKIIKNTAIKISGDDSDINSQKGRITEWEVEVEIKPDGCKNESKSYESLIADFTYSVTEDRSNHTKLKMDGQVIHDISKYNVQKFTDIHEKVSGKIEGSHHDWIKIGDFDMIKELEVKIDGKGSDQNNIGVKCELDVAYVPNKE